MVTTQHDATKTRHYLYQPYWVYIQVYELEGVVQMHDAHFWTLCTGTYYGTLTLDVMAGTDTRRTLAAARNILIQVGGAYINTIILKSLSFISVSQAGLTHVTIELNQMD